MNSVERRKYKRFPVLNEVVRGSIITEAGLKSVLILNLSAGGAGIASTDELKLGSEVVFVFKIDAYNIFEEIKGRIVWGKKEDQIYNYGVMFLNTNKKFVNLINGMADDYYACEIRISMKTPDVCYGDKCGFYPLCFKKEKV